MFWVYVLAAYVFGICGFCICFWYMWILHMFLVYVEYPEAGVHVVQSKLWSCGVLALIIGRGRIDHVELHFARTQKYATGAGNQCHGAGNQCHWTWRNWIRRIYLLNPTRTPYSIRCLGNYFENVCQKCKLCRKCCHYGAPLVFYISQS